MQPLSRQNTNRFDMDSFTYEHAKQLPKWKSGGTQIDHDVASAEGIAPEHKGMKLPLQEFRWAFDPGGNLCAYPIRSNGLDPRDAKHRKHGAETGYAPMARIQSAKAEGWRFFDDPEILNETPEERQTRIEGYIAESKANRQRQREHRKRNAERNESETIKAIRSGNANVDKIVKALRSTPDVEEKPKRTKRAATPRRIDSDDNG